MDGATAGGGEFDDFPTLKVDPKRSYAIGRTRIRGVRRSRGAWRGVCVTGGAGGCVLMISPSPSSASY